MASFNEIISDLKKQKFSSIYFLEGEEPYFIDQISDYITDHALTEEEKGFNQTILYGKDSSVDTILTAAKRYPMMAKRQVVAIREAQNIKDIDELASYVEKPLISTILVISYKYKTIDKRKRLYKALQKNGIHFESKAIYDNKIPEWIISYLKAKNLGIMPVAAQMIADHVGNNLQRIVNELDKIIFSMVPGTSITLDEVEKNIGISKEYNVFELQNALSGRDILKANRIINYMIDNEKSTPMVLTISNLASYFKKILLFHTIPNKNDERAIASKIGVSPFFVKDFQLAAKTFTLHKAISAITLLREADLRSKGGRGGSAQSGEIQRELIYKLLHI
jgi:DNA polymerase-3 subunit delta